jgi:hypothetical protein
MEQLPLQTLPRMLQAKPHGMSTNARLARSRTSPVAAVGRSELRTTYAISCNLCRKRNAVCGRPEPTPKPAGTLHPGTRERVGTEECEERDPRPLTLATGMMDIDMDNDAKRQVCTVWEVYCVPNGIRSCKRTSDVKWLLADW